MAATSEPAPPSPHWEWDGDTPEASTCLRLRLALPEAVRSLSDLDVSVESRPAGEERLVVLAAGGSVLLDLPLPGKGEDSGALRASFGRRTRQLKVSVPIKGHPLQEESLPGLVQHLAALPTSACNAAAPSPAADPMNWIKLQLAGSAVTVCDKSGGSGCTAGRHLVAARALRAGDLLLEDRALLATVSDKYLSRLCAACVQPLPASSKPQPDCAQCHAVLYCSEECRANDAPQHKAECDFLKAYHKQRPGGATGGMRLVLRLLWELEKRAGGGPPSGWDIFAKLFQEVPLEAPRCEDDTAPLAVFRKERAKTLRHEMDTKAANLKRMMGNMALTQEDIVSALAKLQANGIGICNADGGNLGTGARAMRDIVPGEALTIGYTELYETTEVRQRSLFAAKGFQCLCPRCEARLDAGEGDGCIAAWSNPRRAGAWLFHPDELRAMGRGAEEVSADIDPNTVKVMTEQDGVWRERLARGLAYLGPGARDRQLRRRPAGLRATASAERPGEDPGGERRQAPPAPCRPGALGAIQEHCCALHPGRAYLLRSLGEMTMKQALAARRASPMQAKLLLAGSVKQLQDAEATLALGYGGDHPDVTALQKLRDTAQTLLQRIKAAPA
eukprot:jgi/Tetstr1/463609/TSEL_000761.t1